MQNYSELISKETGIRPEQIDKTLELLDSGATVPFISRYRKETTGSLDEEQITKIRDRHKQMLELDKRREAILESIDEQGMSTPELKQAINSALTMTELEDLYLPYKPKKRTRATIAIEKGLEPLAKIIMKQDNIDVEEKALAFINDEKEVTSIEDALSGARDIIAEWVNENARARASIRRLFEKEALIYSKPVKGKEKEGEKYENYFEVAEEIKRLPSHRILAMYRGEKEGFLKISIKPEEDAALDILERIFIKSNNESSSHVVDAIKDSYKRLMSPSIETEIRAMLKGRADSEAIRVFSDNLRQLLLAPPLGQKNILAIDPGFRTGCKVVCLDKQGKLLHNENIYPHPPQKEQKKAASKIQSLVSAYNIEAIAIGNGTAGRETETFIRNIRFEKDIIAVMVNESGASVYSASAVAREEFPEYDVTVRGAVSIGRRLSDPLAELVKIDPKSIGVGQYQHDVDQKELKNSLDDVVISCVNSVGVELNTASKELLTYVSGLGPSLAAKVVEYRNKNGSFKNREALKKVPRFGDKAFEQSAGFLRVSESDNILDKTAVHPESYHIVDKMAKSLKASISDLVRDENLRSQIKLEDFISDKAGLPTLKDIFAELARPGRDPREKFDVFEFDKNVNNITDIQPGMVLPGIVTNITAFGAFVDIGVHQDGLVHISNIANRFVRDPAEELKLNQKVKVKVLDVDVDRKRINLSIKDV